MPISSPKARFRTPQFSFGSANNCGRAWQQPSCKVASRVFRLHWAAGSCLFCPHMQILSGQINGPGKVQNSTKSIFDWCVHIWLCFEIGRTWVCGPRSRQCPSGRTKLEDTDNVSIINLLVCVRLRTGEGKCRILHWRLTVSVKVFTQSATLTLRAYKMAYPRCWPISPSECRNTII